MKGPIDFQSVLLILVIAITSSTKASFNDYLGTCPKRISEAGLSLTLNNKILGTWYNLGVIGPSFLATVFPCSNVKIIKQEKPAEKYKFNFQDQLPYFNNKYSIPGNIEIKNGVLELHLNLLGIFEKVVPIQVLATDYENYAIVRYCKTFGFIFHFETIALLMKDQYITEPDIRASVRKSIENIDIDVTEFTPIFQIDC